MGNKEITWNGPSIAYHVIEITLSVIWAKLCEKVPNVLSRCHTKRRTGPRGPYFGLTPTLKKNKSLKTSFFFKKKKNPKSWYHTKRRAGKATRDRPFFGITTTQEIRDLFALRCPIASVNVVNVVIPDEQMFYLELQRHEETVECMQ